MIYETMWLKDQIEFDLSGTPDQRCWHFAGTTVGFTFEISTFELVIANIELPAHVFVQRSMLSLATDMQHKDQNRGGLEF
jgi:hypothetical protein